MKIITISGLDGSGKSTQVKLLKEYLESQGKRVFYFHAVDFSVANKIARSAQKNSTPKSVTKANWFQIMLRRLFFRIDLSRFTKLVKKLKKEGHDYLVSDRYFYDSLVNIEYLQDKCYDMNSIIKPDLSIYIQTTPEIIMQRDRIPDQGMEYLKKKKELYDQKNNVWNWKIINGDQDKMTIFEEIKSYV